MTDLEMIKKCAERMGFEDHYPRFVDRRASPKKEFFYDPLHDDAQAMALVKKFQLCIQPPHFDPEFAWHVWKEPKPNCTAIGQNLNRAIVQCVANEILEKAMHP